jgi:hypothetical protein
MTTFRTPKTIRDRLTATAAELDKVLAEHGFADRQDAYRAVHSRVIIDCPWFARVIDQLEDTHLALTQAAEREQDQCQRIAQLQAEAAALMLDRDRGTREAGARAEGAWRVAADAVDVLRAHDIDPGAELATLIEDAIRYGDYVFSLLDRERVRLEAFRIRVVSLIESCRVRSGSGRGLTPAEVGKLGRAMDQANGKALGMSSGSGRMFGKDHT